MKFGKYYLLDKVAMGGMAEVYLSKSVGAHGVNKFVAIKRILPQYSENEEFISMFQEEAKIAVNLSHSNIVPIYEFGEEKDRFYLAMEFVPGKNLRQILNLLKKKKSAVPLEIVVSIINEVAKALDYAHKVFDKTTGRPLNIIHRDISPQNMMMSFDGEIKLLDFGIAKAESKIDTTKAGTLKGKFGYMSPEQAEGLEVDYRTDIFSLGIVLWEMLAEDRLFLSNNEINTIRKIRECHIPDLTTINRNVSSELNEIIKKALTRDRNLRYQSAGDLHKDLNKYLNQHFPDFTQQEVGLFMKNLYNQEIIELREKMIEYSKIDDEPSEISLKVQEQDKTRILVHNPEKEQLIHQSNEKMVQLESEATKSKSSYLPLNDGAKGDSRAYQWGNSNPVSRGVSYTSQKKPVNSGVFTTIIMSLMVVMGVFFFIKNDPGLAVKFGLENPVIDEGYAEESSVTVKDNRNLYAFNITSTPQGAAITINGKTTGFYTPGRVKVPPNTQISLSLNKDGYFPYSKNLVATTNGQQFNATLQRAQFAYVTLRVHPGQAQLFINGQKLSESPPLKRYAVPANEQIHIRAYNPITGATAEKYINLRQDTHRQLSLFLKK
ncbi:MAG: protein kinase [Bdellovibrionales bacterium]